MRYRHRAPLLVALLVAACGGDDAPTGADAKAQDAESVDIETQAAEPDAIDEGCEGAPDGTPCDDGNACTTGDGCESGVCVGATSLPCDSPGPCVSAACDPEVGCITEPVADATPCSLACFGEASCKAGACMGSEGTQVVCPAPHDPCVERIECHHTTGECSIEVLRVEGTPCNADGDVCTLEECTGEGACTPTGQLQQCGWMASNDPCWTYACDKVAGCAKASFIERGSCNDKNPCTVDDRCMTETGGEKVCVGKPLEVDDFNPCTDDLCTNGKVVHTVIDGLACVPTHPCAQQGVCQEGACVPNDPACACSADGDCDDGDPCTGDSCGRDGLCTVGADPCDDGDPCTDDWCEPELGCTHTPGAGSAEVCDGLDNDCDGLTDEDFPGLGGPCDGPDEDACAGGVLTCAAGGVACIGDESNVKELCNGQDDDCDGLTDEGFPGLGAPCDGPDSDLCAYGKLVCAADGLGTTCGPETLEDIFELCNGLDDDCDGAVDEGFGVGVSCDGDDADLCPTGTTACAPDELGVVCIEVVTDIPEVCNGKDDDCDGETDEGFGLGEPCDGPDSDLCAHGVRVCAPGGLGAVCGPEAVEDIQEKCNGLDDDCDGETDEDFPSLGAACDGPDGDSCPDGTVVCLADGTIGCDEGPTGKVEVCNGIDDDCDGLTDEGFGVGTPCDGPDEDLCANGVVVCEAGGAVCGPEGLSFAEVCNGVDDDCDGETDEGFPNLGDPCDGPDPDLCATGTVTCTPDGSWVECTGESGADTTERCNGLDDDCDGETDEGFPGLGAPCDGPDADLCATGVTVCAPDGFSVECGPETLPSQVEVCNGLDDDCDGETDEGFEQVGQPCDGPDSDSCALGVWVCAPGGLGVTCGPESATDLTESCNGVDDDCDGLTDEDFPGVGDACDGPDEDDCQNGLVTCDADGGGTYCAEDGDGSTVELCNGKDDDCDGLVDEDWPDKGLPCDGADDDLCQEGSLVCNASGSGLLCNDSPSSKTEVCNGLDDDCDGETDEGFVLGATCDSGADSDLCLDDVTVCAASGLGTTCADVGGSLVEICNGLDDDCDGQTDEDWPQKGQPCDGDDSDLCTDGHLVCGPTGKGLVCNDDPVSKVELCNGKDDDCDGLTDEGWPQKGQKCDGDDADLCPDGVLVCGKDGASLVCDDDAASVQELCNDLDDDCDGLTDENWPEKGQPCDGADSDSCPDGVWVCSAGKLGGLGCTDPPQSNVELCNGQDDDCDGETDEGFDVGAPCDSSDPDLCQDDVKACTKDGYGTVCQDMGPPIVEMCNGLDDDCDGAVDEGFDVGAPCDGTDADLCLDDIKVCSEGGGGTVCQDQGPPLVEVCNAKDDDCDGVTDPPDTTGCTVYYVDADGDGYGAGAPKCLCAPSGTYKVTVAGDCDDSNPAIKPGGASLCGADGDCNGALLDPGEACDDGNDDPYDGCMSSCLPFPFRVHDDLPGVMTGVDVAGLPDGGILVSLNRTVPYPGDGKASVLAARFNAAGQATGGLATLSKSPVVQPARVARHASTASLFVWGTATATAPNIKADASVLNDAGVATECLGSLSQATQAPQQPPVVAATGGGQGAGVWTGTSSGEHTLFRRHVSATCTLGATTWTSTPPKQPALFEVAAVGPVATPGYVVASRDVAPAGGNTTIRAQRFGADGTATTSLITVATAAGDTTISAQPVAWGDDFLVIWCETTSGIFLKRYTAVGTQVGTMKTLYSGTWIEGAPAAAPASPGSLFLFAATSPLTGTAYVRMLRFGASFGQTHDKLVSFPDQTGGPYSVRAATTNDGVALVYLSRLAPWEDPVAFALRVKADGTLRYR